MPVKLYVGTDPADPDGVQKPYNFFHEQHEGAIRIFRRLWAALHHKDDVIAIVAEVDAILGPSTLKADMLVITPRGIGILEQKHYGGEIGLNQDETWYYTKSNGVREKMESGMRDKHGKRRRPNPCEQVLGYHKTLRKELHKPGLVELYRKDDVQTSVCFTNRTADFTFLQRDYEPPVQSIGRTTFRLLAVYDVLAWAESLNLGGIGADVPESLNRLGWQTNARPMIEDVLNAVEWHDAYGWMPQDTPYSTLIEIPQGKDEIWHQLAADEVVIGREGDIVLPEVLASQNVGRHHVEIERFGDQILVKNIHDKQPIWISGIQLEAGKFSFLNRGDTIMLTGPTPKENVVYFLFERPPRKPNLTGTRSSVIRKWTEEA